jgi:transcriptional regulator with XRE-family HTH domain
MAGKERVRSKHDAEIGRRIREAMEAAGVSVADLAAVLGRSPQVVRKILTGDISIAAGRLPTIARVLGVPASAFLEGKAA